MSLKVVLPVFVLLLFAYLVEAQQKPCGKPQLRANRKKHAVITGSVNYTARYWTSPMQQEIRQDYDIDSTTMYPVYNHVKVKSNGQEFSFAARSNQVLGAAIRYIERDTVFVDSLGNAAGRRWHNYFGFFSSNRVRCTFNEMSKSLLYYAVNGVDSFRYVPAVDGYSTMQYGYYGQDSLRTQYEKTGTIMAQWGKGFATVYKAGLLWRRSFDTLITERNVRGVQDYYLSGKLAAEYFYANDSVPCCTWAYYDSNGKLLKKLHKISPEKLPRQVLSVEGAAPPVIFTYVEEMPRFGGGVDSLKKYLSVQIQQALCLSSRPLEGAYRLKLEIKDYNMHVLDVKGLNASAISEFCKQNMSFACRPGKVNGMPVITECFIDFNISRK